MQSRNRISSIGIGVFVGCGLVYLVSTSTAPAPAAVTAANSRKSAPSFTLKDSTGVVLRLSEYKGKVVVLNFWSTHCGWCKVEIPWLMEFETKHKATGLAVIGVSMDEDGWKAVKPFLEGRKLNYPVVVGNEDVAKLYGGVDALPMTLLIDRDGRIAATHVGLVDKGAFEQEIRILLQESYRTAVK